MASSTTFNMFNGIPARAYDRRIDLLKREALENITGTYKELPPHYYKKSDEILQKEMDYPINAPDCPDEQLACKVKEESVEFSYTNNTKSKEITMVSQTTFNMFSGIPTKHLEEMTNEARRVEENEATLTTSATNGNMFDGIDPQRLQEMVQMANHPEGRVVSEGDNLTVARNVLGAAVAVGAVYALYKGAPQIKKTLQKEVGRMKLHQVVRPLTQLKASSVRKSLAYVVYHIGHALGMGFDVGRSKQRAKLKRCVEAIDTSFYEGGLQKMQAVRKTIKNLTDRISPHMGKMAVIR